MTYPKVSIIMTTYNSQEYVEEQLQSLVEQTFKDWELVISDDASSDDTVSILRAFAASHENVTLILNEENVKQAKNFERGLVEARGEYVAICDSDDYWLPEKLEEQVKLFENNPDIDLIYHDLSIVDENLRPKAASLRANLKGNSLSVRPARVGEDSLGSFLDQNHMSAATMMFHRRMIDYYVPLAEGISKDYWIALVTSAHSRKIYYLDKVLMYYRQHSSNITGAGIKGAKYLGRNLFSKDFGRKYLSQTTFLRSALTRIRKTVEGEPYELITDKIRCLDAVILLLQSSNPLAYIVRFFAGVQAIIGTGQRNHIIYLFYFAIYKANILRWIVAR